MSGSSPLAVQAVVAGNQLDFTVLELAPGRATVLARAVYDHYLFKKGEAIEVFFPDPVSSSARPFAGVIASHRLRRTAEGELDLMEVVFQDFSEEDAALFGQLLAAYPSVAPKPAAPVSSKPPERPQGPEIRELPAKLFLDVLQAPEFSEEERGELLGFLDDTEKQLLASGDKGRLAQLVAVKLKLRYELGVFQKSFSTTTPYYERIKAITDNNSKIVDEWLPSLDPSTAPEGMAERFEQLKQEVARRHAEQRDHVKATEDVVRLDQEKAQERAKEMIRHSMEGPAFRPAQPETPEKKEEKAPAAAVPSMKRGSWVGLQIAGTILCLAIILVVNLWDQIVAMTLPTETVVQMISKDLPITKTSVRGAELYIYIDDKKIDTRNKALMGERGKRSLAAARKNHFEGIRIFANDGRRLYVTAYANMRNVEPELIPVQPGH